MESIPRRHTKRISISEPSYWLESPAFLELDRRAKRIGDGEAEEGAPDSVPESWRLLTQHLGFHFVAWVYLPYVVVMVEVAVVVAENAAWSHLRSTVAVQW